MSNPEATIVVSGYSSVDYAMQLAPFEGMNATTTVLSRAEMWPRFGGIAHITRAIAQTAGEAIRVVALSWVGADAEGRDWVSAVEENGASTEAVTVLGTRSPSSHLLYPQGQGTICLFDPADCHPDRLTEAQLGALACADVAVVTIGPAELTRALVRTLSDRSRLLWIVKQDPASLPSDLTAELAGRAEVVTLSEEESGYLESITTMARPGTYIALTRGGRGAALLRVGSTGTADSIGELPTTPVPKAIDTTGAGDTFAGTLAVQLATHPHPSPEPMLEFISRAVTAATDMLSSRAESGDRTTADRSTALGQEGRSR